MDDLKLDAKERRKAANRAYYLRNAEKIKTQNSAYRAARFAVNPEIRAKAYAVIEEWRQADPARVEKRRKLYEKNKERVLAQGKAWYEKNKAARLAGCAEWQKENKHKVLAACRRYQAAKKNAVPVWADTEFEEFATQEAYSLAALRTAVVGIRFDVDHIVPLRGRTVSGLHCIANLQVIPSSMNISKGNRLWPDMP